MNLIEVKRRLTIRKLCDSTITTINEYIKVIIIISQAHTDIGVKYKSMKCQCSEDSNSIYRDIAHVILTTIKYDKGKIPVFFVNTFFYRSGKMIALFYL